jgi:hypothetical protein
LPRAYFVGRLYIVSSKQCLEEGWMMVYRGIVKNGVVVLEQGNELPEGIEVRVEPIVAAKDALAEGPTLGEQFADVIGTVPDLPPDMAAQHDHYLHGAPKR